MAHDKVEEERNHFFELDEVNCGIGMPSFNMIQEITKKEVRDLVLSSLSSHDDKFYPSIDAYFQQMDNPRDKLHQIRRFLQNIGWDQFQPEENRVFPSRKKIKGLNENIEEEKERTLQYFYEDNEPRGETVLVAFKSPLKEREEAVQRIAAKYMPGTGKRKSCSAYDASSHVSSKRRIDFPDSD